MNPPDIVWLNAGLESLDLICLKCRDKQHRGNPFTWAPTKNAHFTIILIGQSMISNSTSSVWPLLVDFDDVKKLLSDGILTL